VNGVNRGLQRQKIGETVARVLYQRTYTTGAAQKTARRCGFSNPPDHRQRP